MDSNLSWTIIARRMDFLYKWLYRLKKSKRWRNDLITKQEYKTYKWYIKNKSVLFVKIQKKTGDFQNCCVTGIWL